MVTVVWLIRFPNRHQVAAYAPQSGDKMGGSMDIETALILSLK